MSSVFTPRDGRILYGASLSPNSTSSENRGNPGTCDPMSKPSGLAPIKNAFHISALSVQKRERAQRKGVWIYLPQSSQHLSGSCILEKKDTLNYRDVESTHSPPAGKCKATGQPRLPVRKAGKPPPPRPLSDTGPYASCGLSVG